MNYIVEKKDGRNWVHADRVPARSNNCNVHNLRPGSDYYFRVYAENEIGSGEPVETTVPVYIKKEGV